MQMGMVGLGRMGASMVRRLMRGGHECVVYDVNADAVARVVKEGARGTSSLEAFAAALKKPRVAWMMVPAAVVEQTVVDLSQRFDRGDVIVDGGNSHYVDDIRRAKALATHGMHYVDAGTSGGVWGLERGFCQMIGGEPDIVQHLDPLFATLAPAVDSAPRTPGRNPKSDGTAEHGYLHCGPNGAGHFVKMVHNGIEYGIMAAYAEGLNILRHANVGAQATASDAETTPLRNPELYQYDLNLPDITEVWRRGSVIASWLLDLTSNALAADPHL
jgi:6-phosphogluconate dehydrogenase